MSEKSVEATSSMLCNIIKMRKSWDAESAYIAGLLDSWSEIIKTGSLVDQIRITTDMKEVAKQLKENAGVQPFADL